MGSPWLGVWQDQREPEELVSTRTHTYKHPFLLLLPLTCVMSVSPCKYLRCCEFHLGSWHGRTVSATSRRPPPLPLAAKTALRMLLLGPARLLCITSKRHQRSSSSSSRACSRSCSSRCPTTSTTTAKGRWPPQPEPNPYYSKTVNNHRFLLSQLTMMVMTLLFSLSLSLLFLVQVDRESSGRPQPQVGVQGAPRAAGDQPHLLLDQPCRLCKRVPNHCSSNSNNRCPLLS
jgi:hypothetical protein